MCGIAGVLGSEGVKPDPAVLDRMIRMIRHRGPDDCGVHIDGNVGLGHARLSIIDLACGQQPMHNEDRSLTITFNGEIFNYLELREELLRKGHRFATQSDTEVILHSYEEKGEDCVQDFNGQWAFAIWDAKKRRMFLSRDRLGVRPLFYTTLQGTFLFASEIKSLLTYPGVQREIDIRGLDQIFTFWLTLPPRTIFRGISEMPPGHSMIVQDGGIQARPYWTPDYPLLPDAFSGDSRSAEEHARDLLDLLVDATRIRLRADVPVGAYLSGGLDSSLITALICRFTDTPLKTFSVSFEDPDFDESSYQKEVTRFLGTEHQEVRCTYDDIGQVFPHVIWHAEKPILRAAPAPLYILSRLVRENGYKVVLTGEGSDELLGGYDIFKEAKIRRFWGAHPDSAWRPLLLKRLYPYLPNLQTQSPAYLKAFFHVKPEELSHPFFSHLPRWEMTSGLKIFFSDDVKDRLRAENRYQELLGLLPEHYTRWNSFCQAQYLESAYLLPGYILSSQGDRVAMAHAVEGRYPFLDYRVAELAARIPPRLQDEGIERKVYPEARRGQPGSPVGEGLEEAALSRAGCEELPGGQEPGLRGAAAGP